MQKALRHGQPTQFWVTGVRPGEVVSFLFNVIGAGAVPCAAQYGGLCVDLVEPALLGEVTADVWGPPRCPHAHQAKALVTIRSHEATVDRCSGIFWRL